MFDKRLKKTLSEKMAMKIEAPKWLVADMIPQGLGIIYGDVKNGKSRLALQLLMEHGLGRHPLRIGENGGGASPGISKCAYFNINMMESDMVRMLKAFEHPAGMGLSPRGTVDFFERDSGAIGAGRDLESMRHFFGSIANDYHIVVVDTFAAFRSGYESASRGLTSYEKDDGWFNDLREAFEEETKNGILHTVVFLHHPEKALGTMSGSVAISGGVTWFAKIEKAKETRIKTSSGGEERKWREYTLDITSRTHVEHDKAVLESLEPGVGYDIVKPDNGFYFVGAAVEVKLKGLKAEIFEAMKAGGITSLESAIGPTAIAALHKEYHGLERMVAQPNISRALKGMSDELSAAPRGRYFVSPTYIIG